MRVPIPITILLAILAVALPWWIGTRNIDFLTPPSEAKLESIRNEALASLVTSSSKKDVISIQIPIPDSTIQTSDLLNNLQPVDIGDISSPPALDSYSERAPEGAETLLRLAAALENEKSPQRAALAYERVIDLAQAEPQQIQEALLAIRRIRPSLPLWNQNQEKAFHAVIHIGTSGKFAAILPEILNLICTDLNNASSGIVTFSHELHLGNTIQDSNSPTPLAVWITGKGEKPASTDALSFASDKPESLRLDLLKTIFNLTRSHLSKNTSYNPAPEALEDPMTALQSNITCLLWKEFGSHLNPKTDP